MIEPGFPSERSRLRPARRSGAADSLDAPDQNAGLAADARDAVVTYMASLDRETGSGHITVDLQRSFAQPDLDTRLAVAAFLLPAMPVRVGLEILRPVTARLHSVG